MTPKTAIMRVQNSFFMRAIVFILFVGLLSSSVLHSAASAAEEKPPVKPEPKPAPEPQPAPAPAAKPEEKPKAPAEEIKKAEVAAAPAAAPVPASSGKKTVVELTKDFKKLGGLFEFYLQMEKGKLLLHLKKDQLGKEFIYFPQTIDGVVQSGFMRGQYGSEAVIRWRKVFDRIEVRRVPTGFYFEPGHPLERAAAANTSEAVLASEVVMAEDETGYLIDAGSLFLRESLLHVHRGGDPGKAVLGKLSEQKTHVTGVHIYPDNALVQVAYVYENPAPSPGRSGQRMDEIADPRYVTLHMQHALVRMPENDFKPRWDDPRVGYFMTQVTDMTSAEITPYRDVIHRWHLVKQKPGIKLSEPVTPITYWIENTTPVEFRDTIRKAALAWNEAFETAGFKDAVVVKQQPDNATWNAGDINYNVLRWTSSPNPPFGGYGPSFVNPRTGQILGADIMLEFSYMTKRLQSRRVLDEAGLAGLPAFGEEENAQGMWRPKGHECLAGSCAHQGLLFGGAVLRAAPMGRVEMNRMLNEALHYLVLHEVGHTLGLNHNFRGSQLHDAKKIHDKALTEKVGLLGSVMDYPTANVAPEGVKQGQYYCTKPGPYDHWAIEFGYSEALEDPVEEDKRLRALAGRSHRHELGFANDADDMRSVGKGIDPRAMLFDLSSEVVDYSAQRCTLAKQRLEGLLKRASEPGESWQQVVADYAILTSEMSSALVAVSRQVGGVEVERAYAAQGAERKPFTPITAERQKAALALLAEHGFGPQAWQVSADLAAHLQLQRRGFDHEEPEDPRLHERAAKVQRSLLDHLLHSTVLTRLSDSALYGNEFGVADLLSTLSGAIFKGDPENRPNTLRQTLQAMYLERLLAMANSGQMISATQAAALSEVITLKRELDQGQLLTGVPQHQALLRYKIRRALDEGGD
jgi:hypothetical protein